MDERSSKHTIHIVFALTALLFCVVALLPVSPSAQSSADSLAIRQAIGNADTAWSAGDSLPDLVDLAAAGVDSLLPVFVGFGVGEKLVYAVQYGIINAGEATLEEAVRREWPDWAFELFLEAGFLTRDSGALRPGIYLRTIHPV